MSIDAIGAVWKHSRSTLGPRLVLLAIADYAHDDGSNAFPGIPILAKKAGLSVRATQYALRRLQEMGELRAVGVHPSGKTIYQILLPDLHPANGGGANFAPGANSDASGVQNLHQGGANYDISGDRHLLKEPSIEPSIEPSVPPIVPRPKKARMTDDWVPSPELRAYAVDWGIPDGDIDQLACEFRDYWIGEGAARVWHAAFQDRVRRVSSQYKSRGRASPGSAQGPNAFEAAIVRAREKDQQDESRRNGAAPHDDHQSLLEHRQRPGPERGPDDRDLDDGARGHTHEAVYRQRP